MISETTRADVQEEFKRRCFDGGASRYEAAVRELASMLGCEATPYDVGVNLVAMSVDSARTKDHEDKVESALGNHEYLVQGSSILEDVAEAMDDR